MNKPIVYGLMLALGVSFAFMPFVNAYSPRYWRTSERKWATNALGMTLIAYTVYEDWAENGARVTWYSLPWGVQEAYLGWSSDGHEESVDEIGPDYWYIRVHGVGHFSFGVWIFKIYQTLDCWMKLYGNGNYEVW